MTNPQKSPAEFALDAYAFKVWLSDDSPDEGRNAALRNMRLAILEELSPKQKEYLTLYVVDRMPVSEIAKTCGVARSTVYRTISRAKKRLSRVLRFASPTLLSASLQ